MTELDVERLVRDWRSKLAAVSEDLDRVGSVLEPNAEAMWNAMNGWPPGRGFDGDGRGGSVSFCEPHGAERCSCGGGTTFATASDRTGDAALRPDRAARDRARVDELLASMRRQSFELAGLVARYGKRPATEQERRATLADNEREAGCVSCRRTSVAKGVERWEPVFRGELCRWCHDWRRSTGVVPSVPDLERHHRGQRVVRPA